MPVYMTGILVAAKQRQEFRISLQKRARHRAEKRAEWLETEVNWREVGYVPFRIFDNILLI